MGTYVIGSGGDYADFAAAEAALTLPEAAGTVYQVTGSVAGITFDDVDYSTGLTIEANAGEEADGSGGGAAITGTLTIHTDSAILRTLNVSRFLTTIYAFTSAVIVDDCDFGPSGAPILTGADTMMEVTNCIIKESTGDGTGTVASAGVSYTRCTAVNNTADGFYRGNSMVDCFSFGNGALDYSQGNGDYLASEDVTASDIAASTSYITRTSADFIDYAGSNFNIDPASSLNTSGSTGGVIGAILLAGATITTQIGDIQLDFTPTAKMGLIP